MDAVALWLHWVLLRHGVDVAPLLHWVHGITLLHWVHRVPLLHWVHGVPAYRMHGASPLVSESTSLCRTAPERGCPGRRPVCGLSALPTASVSDEGQQDMGWESGCFTGGLEPVTSCLPITYSDFQGHAYDTPQTRFLTGVE